ncbi:MAG: SGNH/GDSL hydrolase family protein [Verrucomicrobia bacterium]|nr:SGNH/GDSL hydrolase family protein [Verrucomicrobiota bacterium]MBU1734469.1 SGNH/GDSL hydrolase family protein [Verrucomicrobiota bacterium]MBU1856067.1 SGNH/GDSL hydrolase family protein [Verrucomicrobiota bacterium]
MKLTLDQIKASMSGCWNAEEENGAIRFHRMPPPLSSFYRQQPASRVRLECTTCVRLRFISNTATLRLGLQFGQAARPFYQGGLLIDGREHAIFGPGRAAPAWEGRILDRQDCKESQFDLWMPHLVRTDLVVLEIDDQATFQPAPPLRRRWLACGDSITQGMTVPLPTQAVAARCALNLNLDVLNYGIGGAIMSKALSEAEINYPYDVLTVAYGANDLARNPLDQYAANLLGFLTRQVAAHPKAAFILITPIPLVGNEGPNDKGISLGDYRRAVQAVSQELGFCRVVEGPVLVPNDARFFVDNVHPNIAGMATYADHLAAYLEPEKKC